MVALVVPVDLPLAVLVVALVLRGIGMALAQMPATTAAYGAVVAAESGDAATVVNIVQRVGGALPGKPSPSWPCWARREHQLATYRAASGLLLLVSALTVVLAIGLRRSEASRTGLAPLPISS